MISCQKVDGKLKFERMKEMNETNMIGFWGQRAYDLRQEKGEDKSEFFYIWCMVNLGVRSLKLESNGYS